MRQALTSLSVRTRGKGLYDFTRQVTGWVAGQGMGQGLLTLWCRHTSASLTVQENADPTVREDIVRYFEALAPEGAGYAHEDEGPDDMPAHLRAMLTQTSLGIPVMDARPVLGTWQGIYLFEHRSLPREREVVLHLLGS